MCGQHFAHAREKFCHLQDMTSIEIERLSRECVDKKARQNENAASTDSGESLDALVVCPLRIRMLLWLKILRTNDISYKRRAPYVCMSHQYVPVGIAECRNR
jgi:hypothetical protein